MSASRYKKFMDLCRRWPVDDTKAKRDLGAVIRQKVLSSFNQGEASNIQNPTECDQQYESLHKLSTDFYKNKYPRTSNSTALEVDLQVLKAMTSTEGLRILAEEDKSTTESVLEKLGLKSNDAKKTNKS